MAINPSLDTYQKQSGAITGNFPTDELTNRIVSGQLESAYGELENQRQINLERERQAEQKRQFEENVSQQEKARLASGVQGLSSTAMQLGTSYALSDSHVLKDYYNSLFPQNYPSPLFQTQPTVAGAAGLDLGYPSYSPSATGLSIQPGAPIMEANIPTSNFSIMQGGTPQIQPEFGMSTSTPTALTGAEQSSASTPSATGIISNVGSKIGGGIGSAIGNITGSETAATTGATVGSGIGSAITTAMPWYAAAKLGGTAVNAIVANNPSLKETPFGRLGKSLEHPVTGVERSWADMLSDKGIGSKDLNRGIAAFFNPVGAIFEELGVGCIIVTTCTHRDSPEVQITREYRDKFLSPEQLRGYYMIAEKVVPLIRKHRILKVLTKRILVDNLIEYGKYSLGKGNKPSIVSTLITKSFLYLCKKIGESVPQFTRSNGEIY